MRKLLIYIGENAKFDVESTISIISRMNGVVNPVAGEFVGAIFQCEYVANGHRTIVRISPETVVVEGSDDGALGFAR